MSSIKSDSKFDLCLICNSQICNCNSNEVFKDVIDDTTFQSLLTRYKFNMEGLYNCKDEVKGYIKHIERYNKYIELAKKNKMKFTLKRYKKGDTIFFINKETCLLQRGIVSCIDHTYCECVEKDWKVKCDSCGCEHNDVFENYSIDDSYLVYDCEDYRVTQWTILEFMK